MARRAAPNLVTSVKRSVKAMHWLTDTDKAAVDLAVRYAVVIEDVADAGDDATARVLSQLGPQLLAALKSLGGTPADRKAIGAEPQIKSRLAEIRALRSS